MTRIEAIKNLTHEQLEKFLDQVFLTGYNTAHHSIVDPDVDDENPFNIEWLNEEIDENHAIVEDAEGESLIISPLANIVVRMAEFDSASIPDNITWESKILLPKGFSDEGADDE